MDSKKLEDKETIEEISAVGAGAVEVGAVAKKTDKEDEKEEKFRLMIREMLSIYFSKKEEKRKQIWGYFTKAKQLITACRSPGPPSFFWRGKKT